MYNLTRVQVKIWSITSALSSTPFWSHPATQAISILHPTSQMSFAGIQLNMCLMFFAHQYIRGIILAIVVVNCSYSLGCNKDWQTFFVKCKIVNSFSFVSSLALNEEPKGIVQLYLSTYLSIYLSLHLIITKKGMLKVIHWGAGRIYQTLIDIYFIFLILFL